MHKKQRGSHGWETNKTVKDELDGGGAHLYSSTWKAGAGRTLWVWGHIASTRAGSIATQRNSASIKKIIINILASIELIALFLCTMCSSCTFWFPSLLFIILYSTRRSKSAENHGIVLSRVTCTAISEARSEMMDHFASRYKTWCQIRHSIRYCSPNRKHKSKN